MEREHGDIKLVVKMTGYSVSMVEKVAHGRRVNPTISEAFERLNQARMSAFSKTKPRKKKVSVAMESANQMT